MASAAWPASGPINGRRSETNLKLVPSQLRGKQGLNAEAVQAKRARVVYQAGKGFRGADGAVNVNMARER